MGFKKEISMDELDNNVRSIAQILGIDEDELTQEWNEVKEAYIAEVAKAEEPTCEDEGQEEELVDLSAMTLTDKLGMVCHDTLDKILTGDLILESGAELVAVTEAVAIHERLRDVRA